MVRPALIEAYARRMLAMLSKELQTRVVATQRTFFESRGSQLVEWRANLENGGEIRLSATVLAKGDLAGEAAGPSQEDLEELRSLGISPGDST